PLLVGGREDALADNPYDDPNDAALGHRLAASHPDPRRFCSQQASACCHPDNCLFIVAPASYTMEVFEAPDKLGPGECRPIWPRGGRHAGAAGRATSSYPNITQYLRVELCPCC